MSDLIKREDAIKAVIGWETDPLDEELERAINDIPSADRPTIEAKADEVLTKIYDAVNGINEMVHEVNRPSGDFTEREYREFLHGISISLCSKESAQKWGYDEKTAEEIRFLYALADKVKARMKGADDE